MKILFKFSCFLSAFVFLFLCLANGFAIEVSAVDAGVNVSSVEGVEAKQHEPTADELAQGWGTEDCTVCNLQDDESITDMTDERYYNMCPYHQDQSALYPEYRDRPADEVNADIQAHRDRLRVGVAGPALGDISNSADGQIFESWPTYNISNRWGSLIAIKLTSGWYDAEALNNVMVFNGKWCDFKVLPGAGGYDYFVGKQVQINMNLKYDNASLTQGAGIRTTGTWLYFGENTTFTLTMGYGSKASFDGDMLIKDWQTENVYYTGHVPNVGGYGDEQRNEFSLDLHVPQSVIGQKFYNTFTINMSIPSTIYWTALDKQNNTPFLLYSWGNYQIGNYAPTDMFGMVSNFFFTFFSKMGQVLKPVVDAVLSVVSPLVSAISNVVMSIVQPILDGIWDVLKTLFVPEDSYLQDKLEEMQTFASEHFGFLYTSTDIMIGLLQRFANIQFANPVLNLPAVSVFGYTLWEAQTFNFNSFYASHTELQQIRNYFYIASDFICFFGLLNLVIKKSKEVFNR